MSLSRHSIPAEYQRVIYVCSMRPCVLIKHVHASNKLRNNISDGCCGRGAARGWLTGLDLGSNTHKKK